jgi:Fe-Mn family superoxide dismutase
MRAFRFNMAVFAGVRGACTMPNLKKPAGGEATLPKLDYPLEAGVPPVLSPKQLMLHYTKHHKAYVDKLNELTKGKADYEGKSIEQIALAAAKGPLFNQAAQHFNHSFYWKCITPNGTAMSKELEAEIAKNFESVDAFKEKFLASALGNFGSGWTWLAYCPKGKVLKIVNTGNAAMPQQDGLKPIFTMDVWEHAYYPDFENRRGDYVKDLWKIVDWKFVAETLAAAK